MTTYLPTVLIGTTRDQVLKELRRRSLAGELHSAGPDVVPITRGPHAGHYAIPVYLRTVQREQPSWIVRHRVAVVTTTVVATLAAGVWWVLSTLSAVALAALLVGSLVAFVCGVHRATRVQVTTTTTTRVTVR